MTTATLIREIEQSPIKPLELLRFLNEPHPLSRRNHVDRAVMAEAEYAAKTLAIPPRDLWQPLERFLPVEGGSFLTPTNTELFYVSVATGTQLNTFTTEASLQGALPHVIIPAGFWANATDVGKSISLIGRGRLGTTGTPTFTFTVRLLTSTTWSAGGVGVSSAAITAGSGVTLAPWALALDIICRSVGAGGGSNTTLAMLGDVRAGTAFAAGGGIYSIPPANTAFTVTLDHTVTQYLYLSAACGTSNASNLIQLEALKVFGEN